MEFYRRLFVLRGKPSRSVHSTETAFSFTPGTTVRFYLGIGSPFSPAPDPGSTHPCPEAAPAATASNNISLTGSPPAPGFFLIFRKQVALSPPCQGEGPSLPASSQIAEQVTLSIAPPECPLHWANKRAHTHTHSPSPHPRKGPFQWKKCRSPEKTQFSLHNQDICVAAGWEHFMTEMET